MSGASASPRDHNYPEEEQDDIRNAGNGVLVETAGGAQLFFSGPGAGGDATAVAVIGDLVQVAKERVQARDARRLACV